MGEGIAIENDHRTTRILYREQESEGVNIPLNSDERRQYET